MDALHHHQPLLELFPATPLVAVARLQPPAAAGRRIDSIRQQIEITGKNRRSPTSTCGRRSPPPRERCVTRTGICLRDRVAAGAAAVARPGAGVAAQHPGADRDRHHAANRRRHRRGRGRAASGGGDPGGSADRHRRGQPARARLRPQDAGLLDAAHRAHGPAAVRADPGGRRGCGAWRAREADGSGAGAEVARGQRRQHPLPPRPDAPRRPRRHRLRTGRARRHAVRPRRGVPGADHR
jgi:hypothetical protein